jgi:hypothetical protein
MKKIYLIIISLCFISEFAAGQIIVGTGVATSRFPFSYYFGFTRDASIYTANEMNTVTTGGTITTISWYSSIASTTVGPTVIYLKQMGTTTAVTAADWPTTITGATSVYSGTPSNWAVGWNSIDITDYAIPAGQNLAIFVETNFTGGGSGGSTSTQFTFSTAASAHGVLQQDNTAPTGNLTVNANRPNVTLGGLPLPSCISPTALAITGVSTNSANFSWAAAVPVPSSGYEWAVTTSSTPPASGASTSLTTSSTSSLLPATTYYLHVRSDCGAGIFSPWAISTAFTTNCNADNIPYLMPISGVTTPAIPLCTSVQDIGSLPNTWISAGAASFGSTINAAYTMPVMTYVYNGTNPANDWLFTNGLNLTAGTSYTLKFKYSNDLGTTYPEAMKVAYGSSKNAAAMTNPLADYPVISGTTTNNASIIFTPATTGVYYIGFHAYSAADQDVLILDDVEVIITPSCPPPSSVTVGSVTTTTASISWTGAGANILEYGPTGFTPGTGVTAGAGGTVINPASSPQVITGLIPSTNYEVYVRQNCTGAGSGYSTNSTVTAFTTASLPPANDACANATTLVCNAAAIAGTTIGSIAETSPGCGSDFGVWYSFLGDGSTVTITSTTTFDHSIALYTGTCSALVQKSCTDNSSGTETNTFTSVNGTTYYVYIAHWDATSLTTGTFNIGISCISCAAPSAVSTNAITSNSANVSWTGSGTYILEYGLTGFTPGTSAAAGSGGTIINMATSPQAITGLIASTGYTVYIRQNCTTAGNGFSTNSTVAFTTLALPPSNDAATGAIPLIIGAGCTTNPYDNTNATQSAGEPYPSCEQSAGFVGMWYSFVAPASGSVKISCDGTGTLGDTRMALFSATNVADYTTFNIIACDDDNGIVTSARSLFYAVGLTPGSTYYIDVDLYSSFSTKGTYCVTVDELNSSMISTIAIDCASDQGVNGLNATYTGWSSMVDATGNLSANVKLTAGTATSISCSKTIKTGAPRTVYTVPYMNRNFAINATGATAADVQFFFTDAELTNLGSTLAALQISRVPGVTCNASFTGLDAVLSQTLNGSVNGVSFIQATTPGFSNFYVRGVGGVLPVTIEYINGTKQRTGNEIDWKISCTGIPEVTMELQRSNDSRNFRGIYTEVASSVRCLQAFVYNDATPAAGINYYRIKTTEPDGKVKYSSIIALINKEKGFEIVSLAPNPARANATLSLASAKAGKVDIVITDVVGKLISKQQNTLVSGNNTIAMNFEALAAGTYNIVITNTDGEVKTTRFVKY